MRGTYRHRVHHQTPQAAPIGTPKPSPDLASSEGCPQGVNRKVRVIGFCWDSWILKDGRPKHAALESALMVYAYGLDHLGFAGTHFDAARAKTVSGSFTNGLAPSA